MTATDCSSFDIAEAEQTVLNVQQNVQDLLVNVDISNIQYNFDKMIQVATDIGFDMDELESLGLDLN